jgi:1-deoxy-D-xylulose-5-phosphate synthase
MAPKSLKILQKKVLKARPLILDFLQNVNDPSDLRKLDINQLGHYTAELRQFLIKSMSEVGGHVAANLGVVELSVALHYAFNTPQDKIVWDVGHQAYAHKIITGRRDLFHTLRKQNGLSGFTKLSESPYDVFGAGHSSTALSAGLGFAEGEWQRKSNNKIISIIGDGALTAGMAFEALNHAGHLKRPNHIIIINDNNMSISENVGAVNNTLQDSFLTAKFFETLGFEYQGPVDGHNLAELVAVFRTAKVQTAERPLVIHVKTKKGFGFAPAEINPGSFHGVSGFSLDTGLPAAKKPGPPTYTQVFSATLCRLAETDKAIVAVTAAMPEGTGLSEFQKLYRNRFYDVGIAEQHAVTFSGALRLSGLKPAVAIYSTFLQRAYDQVIHDIALQKIPLTLFLDRAGLVGADGPTHHGVFDMSFLRCVPGIHILTPKDENELQHMIYTALNTKEFTAVRFPRGEGVGATLDKEFKMLALGKSQKVFSLGKTPLVTIWAAGSCVWPAVAAAKELEKSGVIVDVVNARFIKPLDAQALIDDARKSKLIVSIEENSIIGGLGSAILETLASENIQTPTILLGVPDTFIEHATQSDQRALCHLDSPSIVKEILKKLKI